ncbi:MAG TPA: HEAT repeat domain-containing protein [Planctomycetaceae bacterium]|nr:HEAT repeat domain-containing protein [Planctomycetaceae bacterium]
MAALRSIVALVTLVAINSPCLALDPESPAVRNAIDRGVTYFHEHLDEVRSWEAGIVAYALIRSGESPESPAVTTLLKRVTEEKFRGNSYGHDAPHQFYEAGCDMMMFEAADPARLKRQLDLIVAFTVENQWPSGSWNYYRQTEHGGDTSHSQYAVLGLWAASRAGVKIPRNVWSRVADWHLKMQMIDGGFAYHPGEVKQSTGPMTANGVSSLCIARLMLYPNRTYPPPFDAVKKDDPRSSEKGTESDEGGGPPMNVLQPLDLSGSHITGGSRRPPAASTTSAASKNQLLRINQGISRGANWIRDNYSQPLSPRFPLYYLYGLERMCALTGVDNFEGHDWYAEHAVTVFRKQRADGHFDGECGVPAETAFALLFLSRATSKSVKPPDPKLGGGLMIGGRGLPKNLGAVQTTGDGIKVRKIDAPVDKLLSELENPKSVEVEAVQQAIVDTVQVGDRQKLVGQKDRLKRLACDPRPEVRRTALWALGRCATVQDALVLVKALDDPDINVVVEANAALCWLSRRPNGFGRSIDPLLDIPETASDQQRHDALELWRSQARRDWREWFNQVGPYSERELPIDLPGTSPLQK